MISVPFEIMHESMLKITMKNVYQMMGKRSFKKQVMFTLDSTNTRKMSRNAMRFTFASKKHTAIDSKSIKISLRTAEIL